MGVERPTVLANRARLTNYALETPPNPQHQATLLALLLPEVQTSSLCFEYFARFWPGLGVLSRLNNRIRQTKVLIQSGNAPIDLLPRNNQGRRNHKMRDPSLNRDPLAKHLRRNLIDQQRLTRN